MLRIGQPVAIELSLEAFAADRDFAPLRESRSRSGDSLADLRKRLLAGAATGRSPDKLPRGRADGRWRITYIYGDDRCDLALREAAAERTLRNFPLRYLRALPALVQTPAAEAMEAPAAEAQSLTEFIRQYKK
jgi:hypothetical protein